MVVTKMRWFKKTCRERDCIFLTHSIRKKIKVHETLTHTFTKWLGDKTNQNNNREN